MEESEDEKSETDSITKNIRNVENAMKIKRQRQRLNDSRENDFEGFDDQVAFNDEELSK